MAPGSSGHLRGRRRRLGKWLVQILGKWLVQAIFAGLVSVAIGALWLTLTGDKEQQSYSNSITDSPTTDTVDKPASEVAEGLVYLGCPTFIDYAERAVLEGSGRARPEHYGKGGSPPKEAP